MNLYNFASLTKKQQAKKICDISERILFLESRGEDTEASSEYAKLSGYLSSFSGRWFKTGGAPVTVPADKYDGLGANARLEMIRKAQYAVMDESGIRHSESDFINLRVRSSGKGLPSDGVPRREMELVAYDVRSPFNIGSMVRTAEAFGFSRVVLCGIASRCEDAKIFKTSMMAEKFLTIERCPDLAGTLKYLAKKKKAGWRVVSLEKNEKSAPLAGMPDRSRMIIVVGNEEFGIPGEVLSASDEVRHIALSGVKNSLNVAVAFGISAWAFSGVRTP